MKKILYVQSQFSVGGVTAISSIKENYLVNHGYQVHNLCALNDKKSKFYNYDEKIHFHTIEIETLNYLLSIKLIGKFLRFFYYRFKYLYVLLKVNPAYIILTHERLEPFSVVLLTFWKKRILEFHGVRFEEKKTFSDWFRYRIKFKFYKLVVLTERDKKIKERQSCDKFLVIPNSISSSAYQKSSLDKKNVLILARLEIPKGLVEFLPYWKIVQNKHPDWNLLIYGEGSQKEDLMLIAQKMNLFSVKFFPFSSRVDSILLHGSIYLLPSNSEGFPMGLLESMSSGVPCVAFDCDCGPSDIIKNKEDGYVVDLYDYNSFVNCILDLIEDEDKRKAFGRQAFVNIQRFTPDRIMPKWENLFSK